MGSVLSTQTPPCGPAKATVTHPRPEGLVLAPGAVQTLSPPLLRGQGRAAADLGENVGLLFKEILYLVLYTRPLTRFFSRKRSGGAGGPRPTEDPHLPRECREAGTFC